MQKLQDILSKEMTRKEFIKTLGFGIATIAGFSAVLGMLGKENPWRQPSTTEPFVYGGGPYGSERKKS